uniref:Uncharacterized protein n=1 Tax=Sphaeramia orbicularis TaxID=375764 RepID=A0A673AEX4_9TELE
MHRYRYEYRGGIMCEDNVKDTDRYRCSVLSVLCVHSIRFPGACGCVNRMRIPAGVRSGADRRQQK